MADKKVRWGIISTANIGTAKVIPGIQKSAHSEVVAIASRDLAKAQEAAKELGIPKAYGSYEEMLADPEIDAVYNPLPNHLHVDLTLAAARAGKHVLCEKPVGMNAKDAERLREAPKDIIILEAFMVRFHPQWHRAREIVQSGELGDAPGHPRGVLLPQHRPHERSQHGRYRRRRHPRYRLLSGGRRRASCSAPNPSASWRWSTAIPTSRPTGWPR